MMKDQVLTMVTYWFNQRFLEEGANVNNFINFLKMNVKFRSNTDFSKVEESFKKFISLYKEKDTLGILHLFEDITNYIWQIMDLSESEYPTQVIGIINRDDICRIDALRSFINYSVDKVTILSGSHKVVTPVIWCMYEGNQNFERGQTVLTNSGKMGLVIFWELYKWEDKISTRNITDTVLYKVDNNDVLWLSHLDIIPLESLNIVYFLKNTKLYLEYTDKDMRNIWS